MGNRREQNSGMIQILKDGNGSAYIQWEKADGVSQRAWVQHRTDPERDWARTGRYLNVVRCNPDGNPGGNATDLPIFGNALSDEQILEAFVGAVCAITGRRLP